MNRIFTFAIVSTLVSVGGNAIAFQTVVPHHPALEQTGINYQTRNLSLDSPVSPIAAVPTGQQSTHLGSKLQTNPETVNPEIVVNPETVVQEAPSFVLPQSSPTSTLDVVKVDVAAPVVSDAEGRVVAAEPVVTEDTPDAITAFNGKGVPAVDNAQPAATVTQPTLVKKYPIDPPPVVNPVNKEVEAKKRPFAAYFAETDTATAGPTVTSQTVETSSATEVVAPIATATAGLATNAKPKSSTRVRVTDGQQSNQRKRGAWAWWAFLPLILLPLLFLYVFGKLFGESGSESRKREESAPATISTKTEASSHEKVSVKESTCPVAAKANTEKTRATSKEAVACESDLESVETATYQAKDSVKANDTAYSVVGNDMAEESNFDSVAEVQSETGTQSKSDCNVVSAEVETNVATSGDDFTCLTGIDAEAQQALYDGGYLRYSDIENASSADLQAAFSQLNRQVSSSDFGQWSSEATLAARGELKNVQPGSGKVTSKEDRSNSSSVVSDTTEADDLTKIHGIGPKTAELLRESGITSFRGLYEASAERTEAILANAGSKFALIDSSLWKTQARFAMGGNWKGLAQWQTENRVTVSKSVSKSETKTTSSNSSSDDLTKIRGIGPATCTVLIEKGIRSFEQIAKMSPQEVSDLFADNQSRFQMQDTSTWPSQARELVSQQLSVEDAETALLDEVDEIRSIVSSLNSTENSTSASRVKSESN